MSQAASVDINVLQKLLGHENLSSVPRIDRYDSWSKAFVLFCHMQGVKHIKLKLLDGVIQQIIQHGTMVHFSLYRQDS